MQNYCNIVKNKLDMLIRNMEKNVSAFVVDPKRDFVRKSKLLFSKTMRFILGMGSQTLGKELMEFYDYDLKMVSVSAIVQRRSKILPAAFHHLFHKFNESFSQTCFFHGYRLYAVDGSDIHIPTIPDDYSTNFSANADSKSYNLMHLNALYDLMTRQYIDAVLQDRRKENECSALISMLENIKHTACQKSPAYGWTFSQYYGKIEKKAVKEMLKQEAENRSQMEFFCIDQFVPKKHLLRKIDKAVNFDHIYEMVEDLYCPDNGRPSCDPVVLFKMVIIQHLYGIPSLRRTVEEIDMNVAYRWFLGYTMSDKLPHFATIS